MNEIRDKIWYLLLDTKVNECYSALIVKKYQKLDLFTNVFLVVITSSSVAGWAIWNNIPTLWGALIAISQIITIAKPYFLFPKYIKLFGKKNVLWQKNVLELEELWYHCNSKTYDDDQLVNMYFKIRRNIISFDNVPDDIIFFKHNKEHKRAEYLCNNYIIKI